MLDQVTPEMRKLGEGALPDGGLYPVKSKILILFISDIFQSNNETDRIR